MCIRDSSWGNTTALGVFAWLQPGREYQGEDVELANAIKDLLLDYAAEAVRGADRSPFHAPYGNDAKDFFWGCPVSYTHLDVYKRQVLVRSGRRG